MKKFTLSFFICLRFIFLNAQPVTKIQTKVSSAKIFLKGANISRLADVNIPKGESVLMITNLPHDIDTKTIKLKIGNDVIINSISTQFNFEEKQKLTAQTKILKDRLDSIQELIDRRKLEIGSIEDKIELILKNSDLTTTQTATVVEDLTDMLELFDTNLKTYRLAVFDKKLALKSIKEEKELLSKQLNYTLNKKTQATLEITANIDAQKAQSSKMQLQYFTKNAAWYPKYDARAASIDSNLNLNLKAQIIQTTPEAWQDVKISLSNALPDNSASRPKLEKWQLTYSRYTRIKNTLAYGSDPFIGKVSGTITDVGGEPLIGVNVLVKGTSIGTISDLDGFYELNVPQNAKELEFTYVGFEGQVANIKSGTLNISLKERLALDEVVVTGYSNILAAKSQGVTIRGFSSLKKENKYADVNEKSNAVEYEILDLQDLANDGTSKTIKIKDFKLQSIYEYHTVPKVKPDVYIIARIPNWDQYFFLEGEMNLYFEDTYVGQSILASNTFSDTLDLSLGKDYNVKIKREEVNAVSRKNFIGNSRIDSRNYSLKVSNQKSQAISVFVHDQIPVSIIKDVVVTLTETSGAEIDNSEGSLIWNLQLAPKTQQEVVFAYKVKYPKRENIILD